jgi:predicted nuclease with RNAse H fold
VRSLGIDVGVRKGLDLVLLGENLVPEATHRRVELGDLSGLIRGLRPDVIAIDAPPRWATRGRSRLTEREIRRFGIQSFGTPPEPRARGNLFYEWMRRGFQVFRVAERAGYPRSGAGGGLGKSIEVFPHATTVVLADCLPPPGVTKRAWRTSVLKGAGVSVGELRSLDQVDAALAALTGLFALRGRATALGDPTEGVIVLPTRSLPVRAYRRCRSGRGPDRQARLPGTSPCACGDPDCTRLTAREFAPGHDAKRKSALWRAAREGHDAVEELRRRGWELPPEMR